MSESKLLKKIREGIVIGDGAMGTMIQSRHQGDANPPEVVLLEKPELIFKIHQEYVRAGSDLVETNTLGANYLKLKTAGLEDQVKEINKRAVEVARQANKDGFVAGSVGPTGKLMEPHGELNFEAAIEVFEEQISCLVEAGADAIIIETMSDLKEMRAAVLAAKEYPIPVIAQMTFTERGLTLMGSTPEVVAIVLSKMGVDIVGLNCVAGFKEALPLIARMAAVTDLPLSVFPNAGLPVCSRGKTVYPEGPTEFVKQIEELFKYNVRIIGGCCGTTPEFIPEIKKAVRDFNPEHIHEISKEKGKARVLYLSSNHQFIEMGENSPVRMIGEKLNPTGRDDLKEALREENWSYLRNVAREQVIAGARLLDVNIGISGIDKEKVMKKLVQELQLEVDVPLVLDSNKAEVLEAGLKEYTGRALINSVNGEEESMETIFPLAKKYGAAVIGLTLDEQGIPATVEGRLAIAKRIIDKAREYGLNEEDIVIDTLVLTAGANQEEVLVAVKALERVKAQFGVKTTLGVSNVSHGLPGRELINEVFLSMALGAGLDLPILNPFDERVYHLIRAANLLTGRDNGGQEFIKWYGNNWTWSKIWKKGQSAQGNQEIPEDNRYNKKEDSQLSEEEPVDIVDRIKEVIINGDKETIIELIINALKVKGPQELIDEALIPGIQRVGDLYEEGTYFLPQLLRSAETVQTGFDYLKGEMKEGSTKVKATVLLATVKGDIHDIGKNIVKTIFANHGFEVIDLGANVDSELIVEKALEHEVDFVGLSALMTTTMDEMGKVISLLKKAGYQGKTIIGGAVTSQEFAEEIGADIYASDALDGVRKVQQFIET